MLNRLIEMIRLKRISYDNRLTVKKNYLRAIKWNETLIEYRNKHKKEIDRERVRQGKRKKERER